MNACSETGGRWQDGRPCSLEVLPGTRCDVHHDSLEAAVACGVIAGMVGLRTGKVDLQGGGGLMEHVQHFAESWNHPDEAVRVEVDRPCDGLSLDWEGMARPLEDPEP